MEKLLRSVKKAIPFVLMAGGSFFLFLANVYAKHILDPHEYGCYSYFVTVASVIVAFGMMGVDQTLIRTALIKEDQLSVPFSTTVIAGCALVISCLVATTVLWVKQIVSPPIGGGTLMLIALGYLGYQLNRAQGHLASAQLLNNAWRAGIFLSIFTCSFIGILPDLRIILVMTAIVTFVTVVFLVCKYRRRWIFDKNIKFDLNITFGFMATIATAAALTFGDRFIIEHQMGIERLGKYFYYQNIFLFPLTMIATYTGFKEISHFKLKGDFSEIKKSLIIGLLISTGISIPYVVLILSGVLVNGEWRSIALLMVALGFTRIPYASLSAAQNIFSSAKDLHYSNAISFCSFVIFFIIFNMIHFSAEGLLSSLIASWISRLIFVFLRLRGLFAYKMSGSI